MAKAKTKAAGFIKMQVPAGQANAGAVGPALGQRGLNIMDFCNQFNAKTKDKEQGSPIPVVITYFKDKSFVFKANNAPVSYFLRKGAKIAKGGSKPGQEEGAPINRKEIRKIAETKMEDLNAVNIEGAIRMIEGSARAMGLKLVD